MRELKFRAWWKDTKRFLDGDEWYMTCSGAKYLHYSIHPYSDDDFIIEQYTGLKDENGKEIYENDIVEYTTCYYGNEKRHRKVVEWKEWDSDDFGEPHNIGYRDLSEYMEVVGNIHENPDLLEEK